jgi:hypothetical protein
MEHLGLRRKSFLTFSQKVRLAFGIEIFVKFSQFSSESRFSQVSDYSISMRDSLFASLKSQILNPETTARIGLTKQDSKNGTGITRQVGQDRQNRTPEQNGENRKGRTGQPKQDMREPEQGSRTGQAGQARKTVQARQDRTGRTGQAK